MSRTIQIGEHIVALPDIPKDKNEILFSDKSAEDAYWNRDEALKDYKAIWYNFVPGKDGTKLFQDTTSYNEDDGNLESLNKEDSDWILWAYEREWKRRTYGVFFKNGEEVVWLTGDHWFILAWCKTKRPDKISDYFDYREFQAHYLYLIHHVNTNSHIDGLFLSKAKKTGITNIHWLYFLNKATMTKNLNLGNMNIDQQKGAKTFRDHFMYAFNGLPLSLKPTIKSRSEVDGIITFGARFNNTKKGTKVRNTSKHELNTTVMCVPTMVNAFDVDVFSDTWYDEPPKTKQDFGEVYRSNEAATNLQDTSIGKRWLTSYTPEGEAPSFLSSKGIFFDSELRTITPQSQGRTKTGLICHHIPAYVSWTSSFNKYGRCDEVDAMRKIQFGRDQLKDKPRELQAIKRRYANDKKEAWTIGGTGSVFDIIRLSEIMTDIEEEARNSPTLAYVEGNLLWTNELWNINPKLRVKGQFSTLRFVPLTNSEKERGITGRIREYQPLSQNQQNLALKQGRDEWNCLKPPDIFTNILGADPTQYAAASEVIEGSKNSYIVMNRANEALDSLYGRVMSRVITHEYFARPEGPDDAYDDLLKLIIYTGALCGVEANAPYMPTRLLEEGVGNYMVVKDDDGIMTIWKRHMGLAHEEDKKYHLLKTTATANNKDILENFVRLMIAYLRKPNQGEKDYGKAMKQLELLEQLIIIDIKNSTKLFDRFMSWGWCLLTDEVYTNLLLNQEQSKRSAASIGAVLRALAG